MKNYFVRVTGYHNTYINLWSCDVIEAGYDKHFEKEFAYLYLDGAAHKGSVYYGVYEVVEEDIPIVKEFLGQNREEKR